MEKNKRKEKMASFINPNPKIYTTMESSALRSASKKDSDSDEIDALEVCVCGGVFVVVCVCSVCSDIWRVVCVCGGVCL